MNLQLMFEETGDSLRLYLMNPKLGESYNPEARGRGTLPQTIVKYDNVL